MATATATAKYVSVAPRKMRLVADLIRGKKVGEAIDILTFTQKGCAPIIRKVLESAVANAEHAAAETRARIDSDDMVIRTIMVNEGRTRKKWQAAPRGRAVRIRCRTSHVELTITDE